MRMENGDSEVKNKGREETQRITSEVNGMSAARQPPLLAAWTEVVSDHMT